MHSIYIIGPGVALPHFIETIFGCRSEQPSTITLLGTWKTGSQNENSLGLYQKGDVYIQKLIDLDDRVAASSGKEAGRK